MNISPDTWCLHTNQSCLDPIPAYQVPQKIREPLFDTGSLTRHLIRASKGHFAVHLLRQSHGPMTPMERRLLPATARTLPLIREVLLLGNNQPWVYARTIIPRITSNGAGRYLTQLGNRPLGEALFSDTRIRRGPLYALPMALCNTANAPLHHGWGRCSNFYLNTAPLLVSEYFLPTCPWGDHAFGTLTALPSPHQRPNLPPKPQMNSPHRTSFVYNYQPLAVFSLPPHAP